MRGSGAGLRPSKKVSRMTAEAAAELDEVMVLDPALWRRLCVKLVRHARNSRRSQRREVSMFFAEWTGPSRETQELDRPILDLELEARHALEYLDEIDDLHLPFLYQAIHCAKRSCSRQAAEIDLDMSLLRTRLA